MIGNFNDRKLGELFGINRGVSSFYAARCFESVSCLFYASFEKRFHNANTTQFFRPKIDDHGLRQGDTGRIIARWRRTVASKVALDMLHWVMRSSTHRRIIMAVIMAHDGGTFVRCRRLFCLTNRIKKNIVIVILTVSYTIVHYNVIS